MQQHKVWRILKRHGLIECLLRIWERIYIDIYWIILLMKVSIGFQYILYISEKLSGWLDTIMCMYNALFNAWITRVHCYRCLKWNQIDNVLLSVPNKISVLALICIRLILGDINVCTVYIHCLLDCFQMNAERSSFVKTARNSVDTLPK